MIIRGLRVRPQRPGVVFDFANGSDYIRITAMTKTALLDDIDIV